ncbi:uncharacterized protein LOC6569210 [Drosophila grimshawi]|uniref:GH17736 n=1 Tax=Drosophila grimshawi TaxID=7222 RepID=B4JXP0_DROGR|nr:uncharacterized protein LOC6569210 [Drosophila grimshawi]EDV95139.1 GH17736 [Drosophila grimshawi]
MMTHPLITWASVVAHELPSNESRPKPVLTQAPIASPVPTPIATPSVSPMDNAVPTVFQEPNPQPKNRQRSYRPNRSSVYRLYQQFPPPMGWQTLGRPPPPLLAGPVYNLPSQRTIELQNMIWDREQQQRRLFRPPLLAYQDATVGQEEPKYDTGIQQERDAYAETQWQPLKYSRQVWDPLDMSQRSQDPTRLIGPPPPGFDHVFCGKRSLSIRSRHLLGEQVKSGPPTAYPTPQPMLTTEEDLREQHHFLADKDTHLVNLLGQVRVSNGGTGDGHYVRAVRKLLPMAESMSPTGCSINFLEMMRRNQNNQARPCIQNQNQNQNENTLVTDKDQVPNMTMDDTPCPKGSLD